MAAKLGSSDAQVNLGGMYNNDERLGPRNRKLAIYWYKKAVSHGVSHGADNLAVLYKTEGNEKWSNFWIERAIALGDTEAREELEEWWEESGRAEMPFRPAR